MSNENYQIKFEELIYIPAKLRPIYLIKYSFTITDNKHHLTFFDNYLNISEFELTCTLDSENPLPNINGYLEYFVVKCRNFECKYISVMH